jgi:cell division protein FtsW (lipid II flippase)
MITYSFYGYNAEVLGMYPTRPSNFFRNTLGVSVEVGWVIFYSIVLLFCLIYRRFKQMIRIKSTTLKGIVFGAIMFVFFTELLVAILNAVGDLPKESDILLKSLSYLIAHLILGITIAHSYEFLNKKLLK